MYFWSPLLNDEDLKIFPAWRFPPKSWRLKTKMIFFGFRLGDLWTSRSFFRDAPWIWGYSWWFQPISPNFGVIFLNGTINQFSIENQPLEGGISQLGFPSNHFRWSIFQVNQPLNLRGACVELVNYLDHSRSIFIIHHMWVAFFYIVTSWTHRNFVRPCFKSHDLLLLNAPENKIWKKPSSRAAPNVRETSKKTALKNAWHDPSKAKHNHYENVDLGFSEDCDQSQHLFSHVFATTVDYDYISPYIAWHLSKKSSLNCDDPLEQPTWRACHMTLGIWNPPDTGTKVFLQNGQNLLLLISKAHPSQTPWLKDDGPKPFFSDLQPLHFIVDRIYHHRRNRRNDWDCKGEKTYLVSWNYFPLVDY